MKSFRNFISEEVLPSVQVKDGSIDLRNPTVLASINAALTSVTAQPAVTPYVVYNRISKLLSQFHITMPRKFLDGDKGVEVFEVKQFGHKMGMTDQGEFINEVPATYYLFLQYNMSPSLVSFTSVDPSILSTGGMFKVMARIVDKVELDRLLDMAEIVMKEDAECRQQTAKAMAPKEEPHTAIGDCDCNQGRSPSTKKAVATTQKKSLAEAPETMGDVAKSREGHPNVFHSDVTYKSSAERMKAGEPAYDPHRTEIKRVDEAGMPASVIKHKQRIANMTPEEKAKKFAGKSEEELKDMARRHGYGKDSNEYSKHVKKETLDELYGKGSLPRIAAYHTKKSAESKEQMEKTRSGNKKLPVPKKVTDKVSAKDSAAKYHASQAKRAKGMMEEEQIDEVSKGKAIRAYAAGSTYNYDDEHPKSDAIKGHIVRKFGKKAGEHAERAAYTSLYGRDNRVNRVDQLAHAKPSSEMRKTKSGKIHKQDVGAKKDEIKFRKSMKKFEKPRGHLPEETLDEKLTKAMSAGDVISDFVHSKDPKFKGKSTKERQKMALGAYYGMHPEKSKRLEEVSKALAARYKTDATADKKANDWLARDADNEAKGHKEGSHKNKEWKRDAESFRHASNRRAKGIERANKILAREEQMDEAMGSIKKASAFRSMKRKVSTQVKAGLGTEGESKTIQVTRKNDPSRKVLRIAKDKFDATRYVKV